jgi:hypothetical protein
MCSLFNCAGNALYPQPSLFSQDGMALSYGSVPYGTAPYTGLRCFIRDDRLRLVIVRSGKVLVYTVS